MRAPPWVFAALVGLSSSACCGKSAPADGTSPAPSASMPPVASSAAPGVRRSEDVVIRGSTLAATWWAPKGTSRTSCILVHRWGGDRTEWAPLVAKLPEGVGVLALDLRGHGKSPAVPAKAGPKEDLRRLETEAMADDVVLAMKEADARLAPDARHILVGSSAGATVAVLAAGREPRAGALGLVSPGAGIRGVDLFRPFAAVRHRPSFIASAKDDTIAQETVKTLPVMEGTRATVKAYDGNAHGVDQLGRAHEELWDDLAAWVKELEKSNLAEPKKD